MTFTEQLKIGSSTAQKIKPIKLTDDNAKLIFCGMGGSIMPAEALSMLWLDQPPIYINRTAYLPHWVNSEQAVVCISWSGNTAETVACFEEAITKNIPVWIITAGGRLAKLADSKNVPTVLLPSHNLNPRDALGLMFSALLTLISRSDIMENSVDSSSFGPASLKDLAVKLAFSIGPRTPLLYSSYPWRYLGSFWKIFFNENAKRHSFNNFLPGAAHNEVAGITKREANFFYLILRDPDDCPENNKKLDQLVKFLQSYNVDFKLMPIEGGNRFEKIMSQYLLASAVSTALAHQSDVNPQSTETIENFKHIS